MVRMFDPQLISPTSQYQQWPLGRGRITTEYLRIRVLFGTAVNAYRCVIVEV